MKWTAAQARAINENGNLLVSAAAGSGKTAVLSERVCRLIREGASMNELLIVTYTRAAAAEMKKRIAAQLKKAAGKASGPDAERLYRESAASERANISTLHAFCAELLRRHFHTAGLDPSFRILDEAEAKLLEEDSLAEIMEEACADAPAGFMELLSAIGGDKAVSTLLLSLASFLRAQVDGAAWLHKTVAAYSLDGEALSKSAAANRLAGSARRELASLRDDCRAARDDIAAAYPTAAAIADKALMAVSGALSENDADRFAAALAAVEFESMRFPRGTGDEVKAPLQAAYKALRDACRASAKSLSKPYGAEAGELNALASALSALETLSLALEARFAQKKREAGAADYSDLEHMALSLLENEAIALEYRRRFKFVLVDEYQDSNQLQERIMAAISGGGELFLVGDVKQSIYRFRMAEPGLFMAREALYKAGSGMLVPLSENFRSANAVITAVNTVFSRLMTSELDGPEYDEAARLIPGRASTPEGAVELCIVDNSRTPSFDGEDEDADGSEEAGRSSDVVSEAVLAADRIHSLMEHGQYSDPETGETRPYRYSDFAVLHRSPRAVAELYAQTLAKEGIPAYAEPVGGSFSAIETLLFMDLLRVIDNRRQDIPLLAVLRSPIGGFSALELAQLRTAMPDGKEAVLDSLLRVSGLDTPLGVKSARILKLLERWKHEAYLLPLPELIYLLLAQTGYDCFVRALPGGAERAANIEYIAERARAFERTGSGGLSGFISFMDRLAGSGGTGSANTAGADVVRLLSIHKSKGLEFPVVILSLLGRRFNRRDLSQNALFDGELGIGLRYQRANRRRSNIYREAVRDKKAAESAAEELRVLYVAMTRAMDTLIMTGACSDAEKLFSLCRRPLSAHRTLNAASPLEWLLSALLHANASGGVRISVHPSAMLAGGADALCSADYAAFTRRARLAGPGGLSARFALRYPYEADTFLRAKLSVSELSGNMISMRERPSFIPAPPAATDRGTAAHKLMERISLTEHDAPSVSCELERLVAAGVLTQNEADAVSPEAVARFFASSLGRRLVASPEIKREFAFNCRISACEIGVAETSEPLLLQGVIDCCFIEDGAWVLIDYKTDFVPEGANARDIAMRHSRQIGLYAAALTAATGLPVKERYICLLRINEAILL